MKKPLKILTTIVTLSMAIIAKADPCGAIMCLANNDTKPWGCKNQIDEYFNIRAWNEHGYDPGVTAIWRYEKTLTCKGAKKIDIDRINARYGTLYSSPFKF